MDNCFLQVTLERLEAPLEEAALAGGVSLDAAAARGMTHIALSGSKTATAVLLTSKPQVVRLPIPRSETKKHASDADVVVMRDSVRLLLTAERMGASVTGTVCTTMSGQGSVHLDELMVSDQRQQPTGAVGLQYPNWPDLSAVVGVRNPSVLHVSHETGTESELRVHFHEDSETEAVGAEALQELEALFGEAWTLRETVVYHDAPTLTKAVMKTPVGIHGSQYDLASSVVGKPFSHSSETLEDMLRSTILSELGGSQTDMSEFCDAEMGSVRRARWAGVVASGLSTAAGMLIPYRADGRTVLLPNNQLKHCDSESWMAEPIRPFGADDCDGSASWITSAVSHISNVMQHDPGAQDRFPVLHAVHKSLAHYKVGVSIIGAHAASAGDAQGVADGIAGHAMVLLIPKVQLADALHRGARGTLSVKSSDGAVVEVPVLPSGVSKDEIAHMRFRAMYPHGASEGRALSGNFLSPDESMDRVLRDLRALPGLAAEGTGAAGSTLWVPNAHEMAEKVVSTRRVEQAFAEMTPSQMVAIKDLDAGEGGAHKFYSKFVEVMFSVEDLRDTALSDKGVVASHYVLCPNSITGAIAEAGVSPRQLATGDYSAMPLWTAGTARASRLLDATNEALRHTMPMSGVPVLDELQGESLAKSMARVQALGDKLAEAGVQKSVDELRFGFTFSSLVNNPTGVANVVDLASNFKDAAGTVDVLPVRNLATHKGVDVGVSVIVTMLVPRH